MLRTLFGFKWRESNAHLLLLSKFLHPHTIRDYAESENWKAVLGEGPQKAIKRFLDEGMLLQADLSLQLDYKFKAAELKDILKKQGLSTSGRKDALIQRLVQADLNDIRQAVAGLNVLVCSGTGREIAEQYIFDEKAKRHEVEQLVVKHLLQRNFKEASQMVASYESDQVFPRGMGINWKNYDPARDIEILTTLFSGKPKILKAITNNALDSLRLAAAMMHLWGKNDGKGWLPTDFTESGDFNSEVAIRMFYFYALNQAQLADYKRHGIVAQVEIFSMLGDSCEACKKISGVRYNLNEAIELPHEHCTHQMGCRCSLKPVVSATMVGDKIRTILSKY